MIEVLEHDNNANKLNTYIDNISKNPLKPKVELIQLVQALYSEKSYDVEAYLAHHLIRAGIVKDFVPFVKQYFLIKEAVPDLYFWNIIFLTQFGFKFYYYYWLTNSRQFKLITPEIFEAACQNFEDHSSLKFLQQFEATYSNGTKNRIINLYKGGKFEEIITLLSCSMIVQLKPEKKERFINLRLSDTYSVITLEGDYYNIVGDDYKLRRYKISNFNTLDKIKV
jgi:hypothetical protein